MIRVTASIALVVALALCGMSSAAAAEAWQPGEEMTKDASLLPSAGQAAAVLARRVEDEVRKELERYHDVDGGRALVVVTGSAPDRIKQVVAKSLADSVPEAEISTALTGRPKLRLAVDLLGDARLSDCTLHVIVSGDLSMATCQVAFTEKPWAASPAEYLSRHAERRWIIAWSQHPAASMEEALRDARSVAARQLLEELGRRSDVHGVRHSDMALEQETLQELVAEVQPGRLQTDQFVQSFARPYGDVWRAGVLVDGSPEKIAAVSRRASAQIAAHEARRRGVFFGVAGVAVVVCLTYALLNLLTRGYFTGRLRAAAVLVLIGAIVLLMSVA